MKLLLVTIALVVPIFGRPQEAQHPVAAQPQAHAQPHPHPQGQQQQPAGNDGSASIVNQSEDVGADGTFSFSYETSNGIKIEENGSIRKGQQAQGRALNNDPNNPNQEEESGDVQVIMGSFSYVAPDGQPIMVKYIADENGFQPEGEHLPKSPAGLGGQPQQGGQEGSQYPQQGQQQYGQHPQALAHEQQQAQPGAQPAAQQPLAAEPNPNQPHQ